MTNFAELIIAKRKKLGIGRQKLSKMCGIGLNMIYDYELGVQPSIGKALIILKKLDIPVWELKLKGDNSDRLPTRLQPGKTRTLA